MITSVWYFHLCKLWFVSGRLMQLAKIEEASLFTGLGMWTGKVECTNGIDKGFSQENSHYKLIALGLSHSWLHLALFPGCFSFGLGMRLGFTALSHLPDYYG